jgi:hypothetical protein
MPAPSSSPVDPAIGYLIELAADAAVEVGAKANEIPMFPILLDRIEITGGVITADALHRLLGFSLAYSACSERYPARTQT